ncbi:ABC transporter permease [bacterium]|nr:ABC transporter permease [bacterium]
MKSDLQTIIWKEWKEFIHQRGTTRATILSMLIPTVILGIVFPLETGYMWVESPLSLASWGWVPMLMVATMIADSIAGERERHTLETLLASRLSDSAILFGKILFALVYALGVTCIIVLLGLVTVNAARWEGRLLLYPWRIAVSGAVLSILVAGFTASAGVLISLKASTVRQAQQTMSFGIIIIAFIPGIVIQMLPEKTKQLTTAAIESAGAVIIMLIFFLILLAADIALVIAARTRFKRSRLIVE